MKLFQHMVKKVAIFFFVIFLLIVTVTGIWLKIRAPAGEDAIILGGKKVLVEIADNEQERATGLMHRTSLPENQGMLFVFDSSYPYAFWMKNTLIPLDMIFINSENKIIDIVTAPPCGADPCPTYSPREPARSVLEVNAGFSRNNNISRGDIVQIERKH